MSKDKILEIAEGVLDFNDRHSKIDGLFIKMEFTSDAVDLWLKANEFHILGVIFSGTVSFEFASDLEKWAKEKFRRINRPNRDFR